MGSEPQREPLKSPRITNVTWGRMDVEGLGTGKDFKLYPGGGRAWDWNETATHHSPGIQPADVAELIERGCRVVVLSSGMEKALDTCPDTLRMLRERRIPVHVAETREAVRIYNDLAERQAVGGLFHTTC